MASAGARLKEAGQNVWSLQRVVKYFFQDHIGPRTRRRRGPTSSTSSDLDFSGTKLRIPMSIRRYIPFLGYHHLLMLICMISVTFLGILTAGCSSTSPGLLNVYIAELKPLSSPVYTIRVGYLGLCLQLNLSQWFCSNDESILRRSIPAGEVQQHVLDTGLALKNDVLFPWFLIIAAAGMFLTFLLLATFPGWHQEQDARTGSEVDVKPFPSRPVMQLAAYLSFSSAFFTLVSSVWHHVATVTTVSVLAATNPDSISYEIGSVALGLIYSAFVANVLVFIGLVVLFLSIVMLDRLTED